MYTAAEAVLNWARRRRLQVTWGDADVLDEVREELRGRARAGEFEGRFWQEVLEPAFKYGERQQMPDLRTVVVVAIPRPAHLMRFEFADGSLDAAVPPTYLHYERLNTEILDQLRVVLGTDCGCVRLQTPLKAVAVRLGLARYGRNNITCVPGLGSYHQLVGCATVADLGPPPTPRHRAPALCEQCWGCDACRRACPTGAIGDDRILLHTERCLTLANEQPGPWPDWVPADAHHCLVGCLICQRACPMNARLLRWESAPCRFTEAETTTILTGEGARDVSSWQTAEEKLVAAGLVGYGPIIGRNLAALLPR